MKTIYKTCRDSWFGVTHRVHYVAYDRGKIAYIIAVEDDAAGAEAYAWSHKSGEDGISGTFASYERAQAALAERAELHDAIAVQVPERHKKGRVLDDGTKIVA